MWWIILSHVIRHETIVLAFEQRKGLALVLQRYQLFMDKLGQFRGDGWGSLNMSQAKAVIQVPVIEYVGYEKVISVASLAGGGLYSKRAISSS